MDARHVDVRDRIHLSSGIRQVTADPSSYGGMYYVDNHYKPGLPWRAADKTEMAALLAQGHDFVPATDLQLFRLPDAIIEKFAELEISAAADRQALSRILSGNEAKMAELNRMMEAMIISILKRDGAYSFRGIYFSPMNLLTTGYNDLKQLVGLHIDNSTGRNQFVSPPDTIRLCINLGREDRYFLFVNKTIDQLIAMVEAFEPVDRHLLTDTQLINLLIRYYDGYPVVRIRQRPFEAYLMPADNLIHDGSTVHSTSTDITMTFSGDFTYFKENNKKTADAYRGNTYPDRSK